MKTIIQDYRAVWKNIFISGLAFITCLVMSSNVISSELRPYELPSQKRPYYPPVQQKQAPESEAIDSDAIDESVYKDFEKEVMLKSKAEINQLIDSFGKKLKQAGSTEEQLYYERLLKILEEVKKKKER